MVRPPEILKTARLQLRPSTLDDADEIFARYAQDRDVTKYLRWQPHKSINETREFLVRCLMVWADGSAFPWVLTSKNAEEVLGMVDLRIAELRGELGYVLAKQHWGQGLMAEALRPIVEWGMTDGGLYRVGAFCDIENQRSARVLEKVGMQREGVLRRWGVHPNISDEPRGCFCYSIIR